MKVCASRRTRSLVFAPLLVPALLMCQQPSDPVEPTTARAAASEDRATEKPPKRILWIIPNFRTSPSLQEYQPLSTREKFVIASQDSFHRGTLSLGALFAGEGQLTNANPSF